LPAKGALRQGVIIDLHERLQAPRRARHGDMRDASVAELQPLRVDLPQARRVGDHGAGAVRRRPAPSRCQISAANWPGPVRCTRWA
jgi:hypothetical protein